ncbi:CEI_1a_G0022090.mRNA.1.CDS.1 [Saccharomyces cerevisiae]|nr:EM14S01-3B_G0035150.mRNA.1.CDS.1 [Saccharomyces cerevisiae]CAI4498313.1 AMH_1a_G0022170.mRNA.1.CDS.1 [Saccharomyces cerevisiae]CAI4507365.1 CEI_1a_G0022090.mRNA.1.CDS.1 [Saccharomyces cerevisiae]CAI6691193.1 AMH_1a_G0022170.mRNA.1.CDS.1 [Saccharomyces cerevisiae]CAI7316097.1 CEI_1a_G0022090.mRNA.1.CDS.1 [Saccharomyces cerevisiae]
MQPKTFVHQLHAILLEPEVNKWIYWSPTDNTVFFLKPYDPNFSTHVLKRYFKHGNVNSFVRQLHMYGFHKLSHPSPDQSSANHGNVKELVEWKFTHPSGFFFKEANAGILNKIQRKSTGVGKDGKRKNILSPISVSYVDASRLNVLSQQSGPVSAREPSNMFMGSPVHYSTSQSPPHISTSQQQQSSGPYLISSLPPQQPTVNMMRRQSISARMMNSYDYPNQFSTQDSIVQPQQPQQVLSPQALSGPPMKKSRTLSSTDDLKTTSLPIVNYPMPYHPGAFAQQQQQQPLPTVPPYSTYSTPFPSMMNSLSNSASNSPALGVCNNNVTLPKKSNISERPALDNHIQTLKNSLSTITDLIEKHINSASQNENKTLTNDAMNKDLRTSLSLLQNSKEEIIQLESKWMSMQSVKTTALPLQETTNTSSTLTSLTSSIIPKSTPIITKGEVATKPASY